MKDLPPFARLYIIVTILLGVVLCAIQIPDLHLPRLWLILGVGLLACLAQIRKVPGPTKNSNYDLSLIVYGFALIALDRSSAVWVVLMAGLFDWLWHRDYWYSSVFNIAMWVISISAAGFCFSLISGAAGLTGLRGFLALMSAPLIFTLVNHLMLGVVIKLASGEPNSVSGALNWLPLTMDATLFIMGTQAACIWQVNLYAVVLIATPVYLIFMTLRVPALQRRAESDAKTGVFNVRHFNKQLAKALEQADRLDRPLTVVMSDMDYLRTVNNTYGHLAGDTVLIGIANILRQSVRKDDIVSRFGGEEFAILMMGIAPDEALSRIRAIRQAIEAAEFTVSTCATPIKATMSFGIAGRERVGQTPEEIINHADMAVYQAKRCGRNRVCVYRSGCQAASEDVLAQKAITGLAPSTVEGCQNSGEAVLLDRVVVSAPDPGFKY